MSADVLPFAVRCSRCAREIRFDLWDETFCCTECGATRLCVSCAGDCHIGRILKAE